MSDAKAKAEARRAKILARSTNKVTAVMPTAEEAESTVSDDSIYLSLTETKGKDRPLAARRSLISSTSPMKENGENTEGTTDTAAEEGAKTEEATTPEKPKEVETTAEKEAETEREGSTGSPTPKEEIVTTSSGKSIKYVAKTLEEIEREVAERTAAFDKKTVTVPKKKDDSEADKSTKKDDKDTAASTAKKESAKADEKEADKKKKEETDESDATVLKKQTALKKTAEFKNKQANPPVEPTSILRFLRLIMIVLLASYTGYRTVEVSRKDALNLASTTAGQGLFKQGSTTQAFEVDEFGTPVLSTASSTASAEEPVVVDTKNRTWIQYFQQRLTNQMECSVSAVSLVWYLARLLSPVVNAQYKQKPKQTKPLEMIMNFFTEGINAFMEGVYGTLGEISLHLFVLLVSVTVFTLYFSNTVPGLENAGHGTSPAIIPNTEL